MKSKGFFILVIVIALLFACKPAAMTNITRLDETQAESTISAGISASKAAEDLRASETARALPPPDTPTPSATPTLEPSPTATLIPTPSASPTPEFLFRDEFNDKLGDGWSWIREIPANWDLTSVPGYLRIRLQSGNCTARQRNLLVRAPSEGNFEISTFLQFTPISNFQFAGLMIYQDDANHIQFGRAFCQGSQVCVGNGLYFDSVEKNAFKGTNFATSVSDPALIYLRLRREGASYSAEASENGSSWITIGKHGGSLTPSFVGLVAGQSCQGSVAADFDYFAIRAIP